MSYLYLASGYSHPDHRVRRANFQKAVEATHAMVLAGHFIYSPIVHLHPVATRGQLPTDFEFWKKHNLAMLSKADGLCLLLNSALSRSRGSLFEFTYAREAGLPIYIAYAQEFHPLLQDKDYDFSGIWKR